MISVIFFMENNNQSFFSTVEVWKRTIYAFEVDCYIIVDKTESKEYSSWSDSQKETHVVHEIEDALNIHPDLETVLFRPNSEKKLADFKHPKDNVTYIFGPDGGNLELKADHSLNLGFNTQIWAIQALSIALYDRLNKQSG